MPTSRWMRLQLDLHLFAQLQVERAERLVEQQHLRPVDQRPGERDALTLPAASLVRLAVRRSSPRRTASSISPARRRRSALLDALHLQPVLDVLLHGHVREQRVVLEHGVDVAVVRRERGDVAGPASRTAPPVGSSKPAIMPQHGGLARTGRAEQREELAVVDRRDRRRRRRRPGRSRAEGLAQPTSWIAGVGVTSAACSAMRVHSRCAVAPDASRVHGRSAHVTLAGTSGDEPSAVRRLGVRRDATDPLDDDLRRSTGLHGDARAGSRRPPSCASGG